MTAKVKNLMNELVKRETLEQGGDDAYNALDDKNTWFARRYIRDKDKIIDRIQNMLILGIYPKKEYKEVDIVSENKARKICPIHFDPWNVLFHAIKIVLEPIVERVLIYDSSAGRKGKGQVFGALRTQRAIRRHPKWAYYGQGDLRKYYLTIPHPVLLMILRRYIDDELFIDLIEQTMLDYSVEIEPLMIEEYERKQKYCIWADKGGMKYLGCRRGVKSYLVAFLLQNGSQRVRARTLSVGSSHMNGLVTLVWSVEVVVKGYGVVKPLFICCRTDMLKYWRCIKEIIYRFGVSHCSIANCIL